MIMVIIYWLFFIVIWWNISSIKYVYRIIENVFWIIPFYTQEVNKYHLDIIYLEDIIQIEVKYQTPNSTQTTRSTRWLKSRGGTEVHKYAHQLCDCMEGAHSYTPLGARLFAPACRDRPLCLSECRTVTVIFFFFLVFFCSNEPEIIKPIQNTEF